MACFRGSVEILILFHGSEAVFAHMQEYGNLHKDIYIYIHMYRCTNLYLCILEYVSLYIEPYS